jgi:hypothetical protein
MDQIQYPMQENPEQPEGEKPPKPEELNKDPASNQLPDNVSRTDAGNIIQCAGQTPDPLPVKVEKKSFLEKKWYRVSKEIVVVWLPSSYWFAVTFFRDHLPHWFTVLFHLH